MRIVDFFSALLYPPRCPLCGRELHLPGAPKLCRRCAGRLGRLGPVCPRCGDPGPAHPCPQCVADPPPFRQARACFPYSTASAHAFARSAVLRWKYGHDLVLGQALADHFARCSPLARIWYDVVVPVPIHRTRLQQRGFNQAAILARALARAGGLRLRFVLGRRASRPSQTALGRAERRANTAGVFFLRDAGAICRRRVLLVDDVLTTTATVRGCAEALLSGGAALVDVAALARAADPFARAEPVLQSAANPVLPGTVA